MQLIIHPFQKHSPFSAFIVGCFSSLTSQVPLQYFFFPLIQMVVILVLGFCCSALPSPHPFNMISLDTGISMFCRYMKLNSHVPLIDHQFYICFFMFSYTAGTEVLQIAPHSKPADFPSGSVNKRYCKAVRTGKEF